MAQLEIGFSVYFKVLFFFGYHDDFLHIELESYMNLDKYLYADLSISFSFNKLHVVVMLPLLSQREYCIQLKRAKHNQSFISNKSSLALNPLPVFWTYELVEQVNETGNDVVFALDMINNSDVDPAEALHVQQLEVLLVLQLYGVMLCALFMVFVVIERYEIRIIVTDFIPHIVF